MSMPPNAPVDARYGYPQPFPPPLLVTQDERTMATLAHALQMFGGWIAPLVIFFVKRESKFVSFHALQVLLFHLCWIVVSMFATVAFVVAMIVSFAGAAPHSNAPPTAFFVIFPLLWLWVIAWWVVILIFAIVYGIKASNGEWAMYPIFGKLARRILKM